MHRCILQFLYSVHIRFQIQCHFASFFLHFANTVFDQFLCRMNSWFRQPFYVNVHNLVFPQTNQLEEYRLRRHSPSFLCWGWWFRFRREVVEKSDRFTDWQYFCWVAVQLWIAAETIPIEQALLPKPISQSVARKTDTNRRFWRVICPL